MSGDLSDSITELHTRQPNMQHWINQLELLYQDLTLWVITCMWAYANYNLILLK